ncbi:hypothetical protein PGT21_028925 [Puccinia graminis f. sp. tritici]|uniref:Uncharacterized protein n=1 Tax=Puccinia graminis f. sp. tritici TaxID=56615 RepID=A0A5B0P188_PUCGR|nr:hypothetical protein PGT21_028925 [Puccinia graminis f. sp. tritici]
MLQTFTPFPITSFITKFSLNALNTIAARSHSPRKFTSKDVMKYTEIESNQVLGIYARQKWNHH